MENSESYNAIPQMIIAVAGASSSGKTLLLRSLLSLLGNNHITHIDLDGYHLHTRSERKRLKEYPEDLSANDFNRVIADIGTLRKGKCIRMPTYIHRKGIFGEPVLRCPKDIILVEGLHAVTLNRIANQKLIDYSIFINPDDDLRKAWKVQRDVMERGYSYKEVIKQIAQRSNLVDKYILCQVMEADILFLIQRGFTSFQHRILISGVLRQKVQKILPYSKKSFNVHLVEYRGRVFYEVFVSFSSDDLALLQKAFSKLFENRMKFWQKYPDASYQHAVQTLAVLIMLLYMEAA